MGKVRTRGAAEGMAEARPSPGRLSHRAEERPDPISEAVGADLGVQLTKLRELKLLQPQVVQELPALLLLEDRWPGQRE